MNACLGTSAVLVGLLAVAVVWSAPQAVREVKEGHVGVLFVGGAAEAVLNPGLHWTVPHISRVQQFPVTMQTDTIRGVPCGSSSGVPLRFSQVEVVWRVRSRQGVWRLVKEHGEDFVKVWIRDQVRSQVTQLCSKHTVAELYISLFASMDERIQGALEDILRRWAPDLAVISVRTTKPSLPPSLAANYQEVERVRAEYPVVEQRQATLLRKAAGLAVREVMAAQRGLEIARINASRQLETAASRAAIAGIENDMLLKRAQQHADASFSRAVQAAADEAALLTPAYLSLLRAQALVGNNTAAFFGSRVPRVIAGGGMAAALLAA